MHTRRSARWLRLVPRRDKLPVMETPIPVNDQKPTWTPNAGVTIASLAGALGQFAAQFLRDFHLWDMDANTQGSLTVITMAVILYVHHLMENRK